MNMKKHLLAKVILLLGCAVLMNGCGFVKYSFSGTSIDPDVHTVTINYFGYKALKVNPTLANQLTEAMKDKFKKMTKLEEVEMDGDLEIEADVTGYEVRAASVTANEVAAPTANIPRKIWKRVSRHIRTMIPQTRWTPSKRLCARKSSKSWWKTCSTPAWLNGKGYDTTGRIEHG